MAGLQFPRRFDPPCMQFALEGAVYAQLNCARTAIYRVMTEEDLQNGTMRILTLHDMELRGPNAELIRRVDLNERLFLFTEEP